MKYTIGFVLGLVVAFLAVRMLAERGMFYSVPDDGEETDHTRHA